MRGAAKWVERCLWAIGFLASAICCAVWCNARLQQAGGNRELDRLSDAARSLKSIPRSSPAIKLAQGDVIGRIEIPRLEISTIVFEGTGANVLSIGVGHVPGSPLPGQQGNVVLAAHRDTFFRPLRDIRKLDRIALVTPSGTHSYSVDSATIVTPDHTEVLGSAPGAILTLVTCYPFDWFGHAPKRFIVRAHELNDPASSNVPAPEMKAQTHSEETEVMARVDDLPLAPPSPVQAYRAVPHVSAHSRPKPPSTGVTRSSLVDEIALAPATEPAAQESTEPAVETDAHLAPTHNSGNRMMRGIKKLNPKRLLDRIAGQ
jgi:sortase A